MFRPTICPIIRRNNCIYGTPGICHSVWITVWYAGWNETRQPSTQSDKHQVSHRYSYFSWWCAHNRPKHVEKRNKHVCIYRFQNVFLRCPSPRLHCFLSSHWPSFRFLSFMAFLIPSIQFFFGLPHALFCFGIHFNAILKEINILRKLLHQVDFIYKIN